jgi:hypothetical protein
MKDDKRIPAVFLSLIKGRGGTIVGFEAKPENDRGRCWCTSVLRGLNKCTFTANIQTGTDYIIIENEIVDAGRLFWRILPEILFELKIAIREMHIKSNLEPYLTKRLGGTDGLPYFDGFKIINKELIIQEADAGLNEAIRKTSTISHH